MDPGPHGSALTLVGWIRIQVNKNDPQKRGEKGRNLLFWSDWMSSFEGWRAIYDQQNMIFLKNAIFCNFWSSLALTLKYSSVYWKNISKYNSVLENGVQHFIYNSVIRNNTKVHNKQLCGLLKNYFSPEINFLTRRKKIQIRTVYIIMQNSAQETIYFYVVRFLKASFKYIKTFGNYFYLIRSRRRRLFYRKTISSSAPVSTDLDEGVSSRYIHFY